VKLLSKFTRRFVVLVVLVWSFVTIQEVSTFHGKVASISKRGGLSVF